MSAVTGSKPPVTLDDVQAAARRIHGIAHRTPVMTCSTLDRVSGRSLFFKCESLQKIGAFKFRGACNAVLQLTDEQAARGVVTHSSGNHAQALALAARTRGIAANIVMPNNAPAVKRTAVEQYGAIVHPCEPTLEARERLTEQLIAESGATYVPSYDHPHIIAGQGTATLELLEDVPDLDVLIAPIGGGGLMSGTCIAGHGINRKLTIIGAEPAGADDAARSLAAGKFVPQTAPTTICDGLLTSLGELTWPIIQEHVHQIVTVNDEQVIAAMHMFFERAKLVIEPSAACAVAAALSEDLHEFDGRRIGVIISGGNVDLDRLPWSP